MSKLIRRAVVSLRGGGAFAGLDLDFTAGRYAMTGHYNSAFPAGWSFTRASAGVAQTKAGLLIPFASGLPRITDKGLLIEEARTNKVACFSANPTDLTGMVKTGDAAAVLTLVDDPAALTAAGLSGVCTGGKVFKLDNSLGTTVAVATAPGATGNLNAHTVSASVRGSGTARVRLNSVNSTTMALTAGYQRIVTPNVTATGTANQWSIWVDAGAVAYFILPQLEEGAFVTSPIVTEGATATRAQDNANLTGIAALLAPPYVFSANVDMPALNGVDVRFATLNDGTNNNRIILYRSNGNVATVTNALAGVTTHQAVGSKTGARALKIASRRRAGLDNTASCDGVLQNPTLGDVPTGMNRLSIGNSGGGLPANSYIQRVRIIPGDMSDADLQALTA